MTAAPTVGVNSLPLWKAGHGRSPTLEMRHTVDDRLMIATHSSFLPFRAMLHRNKDSTILFSEEVLEGRRNGETVSRSFVVTDQHVYMMTMPGRAFFSPPSCGGCFALSQFTRTTIASVSVASDPSSSSSLYSGKEPSSSSSVAAVFVVLQFVNGVISIRATSLQEARRIGSVMYSATGVQPELLEGSEDALNVVAQPRANAPYHTGANQPKHYAASIAPSVAPSTATRAGGAAPMLRVGSPTGSTAPSVTTTAINQVLQSLLPQSAASAVSTAADGGGGSTATAGITRSIHTQTMPLATADAQCGPSTHPASRVADRCLSPILISPELRQRGPPSPSQLLLDAPMERSPSRTTNASSTTEASEFEGADVWKSLKRATTAMKSTMSGALPSKRTNSDGRSAAGVVTSPVLQNNNSSRLSSPSPGAPAGATAPPAVRLPVSLQQQQSPSPVATRTPMSASSATPQSLETFLGVLATYMPKLQQLGIDSMAALAGIPESSLPTLMDRAGITKQGHRMLLTSKVTLARQVAARTAQEK
jgi:hypothetical protein